MTTPPSPPPSDWLTRLGQNRQPAAVALLVAGAALGVAALVLTLTLSGAWGTLALSLLLLGVGFVAAGLWYYLAQPETLIPSDLGRILVLIVGGWLGFSLTQHMLALAWFWRETVFGGLEAWQGANSWQVWLVLVGTLAGLAVMFVSLLLGKSDEQSSPALRRLLYGYNAFLSCFLLLIVLVIVNLVAYQYIPARADYTDLKIYTLNPKSENILRSLEKPVKVYVLLDSPESRFMSDVQNLEDNARNVTDRIRFENIVRDSNLRRVAELTKEYNLVDDLGMLVVYGNEDQRSNTFVKLESLYQRGAKAVEFQGENELMSAITFLQENKTRPILYFTQANGELDLGFGEERKPERRAATLKERLTKDNYEVRPLTLGAGGDKPEKPGAQAGQQVPDDAAAVVIAGPRVPFSEQALNALDAYMNPKDPTKKKGKLIVLLDPLPNAQGGTEGLGLETFLAKFNVEVGNNRILDVDGRPPNRVAVLANAGLSGSNPVAAALEGVALLWLDVRTVQPSGGGDRAPVPMNFQPAELLLAVPSRGQLIFAETNLNADPTEIIEDLIAEFQKGNRQKLEAKRPSRRLPVALAVSEGGGGMPPMMDPHAPRPPSTPRLLVFGNAQFVSDAVLGRSAGANYDVLASSVAWLRERPSSIGLAPREHKEYQMEANVNLARLVWLPLGLMSITILGLGLGIWVVRRR
jgi:hypothetical protein